MKIIKSLALILSAVSTVMTSQAGTIVSGDIVSGTSPTFTTADGKLTITGYSDSASTSPQNLFTAGAGTWFGPGPDQAIGGPDTMKLQLAPGAGLTGFGDIYTRAVITISGFVSDPGLNIGANPGVLGSSYSSGVLTLNLDWNGGGNRDFTLSDPSASLGQTLTISLDANTGPQWAVSHLDYTTVVPEPTSLALAMLGGLSAVVLKRRSSS